jgi:2-oxo-4-hydroxy-4-carboxy-5-ureidoimidazoline decarboxylase
MGNDFGLFNGLSHEEAKRALLKCCGSNEWADRVAAARPYAAFEDLCSEAEKVWFELVPSEWLEAFSHHPRIGERQAVRSQTREERRWSEQEQASTAVASAELMKRLDQANRVYYERFGFIFIVCATGKSAAEMLALLESRINNDVETEIRIAAEEQSKITRIRLENLFANAAQGTPR